MESEIAWRMEKRDKSFRVVELTILMYFFCQCGGPSVVVNDTIFESEEEFF